MNETITTYLAAAGGIEDFVASLKNNTQYRNNS